jgi:HlyD family secretion protein
VRRKKILYPAIVVLIILGAYMVVFGFPKNGKLEYEFATIERGTVESTISATGTLSPMTSVEVGTQISGMLDSVFVDYNDRVTAGEVLAVLDTFTLRMAVIDAEANLEKAQAQLENAESEFRRCKTLFERGMISEEEYLQCQISVKSESATLKSADAALARANQNMDYAIIRSPIDGIVISKNVEEGQTVAASLSSPTLFVIAQDLSRMEIHADVDESDIGQVREDQAVRFQVTTYSDKKFVGSVRQVRLEPKTVSNVVTYTVIVEADNSEGLLLPGMTAQLEIITDDRTDVLLVPNKALRFSPSTEIVQEYWQKRQQQFEDNRENRPPAQDSVVASNANRPEIDSGTQQKLGGKTGSLVWYLDSSGQLSAAPFKPGLSDGTNTEVIASREVAEGLKVIVASNDNSNSSSSSSSKSSSSSRQGPPGFRPF